MQEKAIEIANMGFVQALNLSRSSRKGKAPWAPTEEELPAAQAAVEDFLADAAALPSGTQDQARCRLGSHSGHV